MYLDSAYIAKFYLNEPDSDAVRKIILSADSPVSSEWSVVEVTCAFHRAHREGALNSKQFRHTVDAFRKHIDASLWMLVPLGGRLIERACRAVRDLPASVFLRAGDVIQLVSAREANEAEIWTSDRRVIEAAPHFGLTARSA